MYIILSCKYIFVENFKRTAGAMGLFISLLKILCFLFRIMKWLFLEVVLCLLIQCCIGCSIWNQGKPCKCSCEDISASRRQTCYLMCYGGKCRDSIDVNRQTRCYNDCFNTFFTCYNNCPWNVNIFCWCIETTDVSQWRLHWVSNKICQIFIVLVFLWNLKLRSTLIKQ